MLLRNNTTKEKSSRINALKDRANAGEYELERSLAIGAALEEKLDLFSTLRDKANAYVDTLSDILSDAQALVRFLSALQQEARSLTATSQKASGELADTLERLHALAEQLCVITQMLAGFEEIIQIRRSKNPLISGDLVKASNRCKKASVDALNATVAAISSCVPSLRNTRDMLGSWNSNLDQLDRLIELVCKTVKSEEGEPFLSRIEASRESAKSNRALSAAAFETVNEQFLAAQNESLIDRAFLGATESALKAAESAVAKNRF